MGWRLRRRPSQRTTVTTRYRFGCKQTIVRAAEVDIVRIASECADTEPGGLKLNGI